MRLSVATLFLCLAVPTYVEAKPAQVPVTAFAGDRYAAQPLARKSPLVSQKHRAATRHYRAEKNAPRVKYRAPRRYQARPLTLAGGFTREIGRAVILGGRPAGCPARAWCGCWMASHLGIRDRSLWLARNWARVGSDAGGPRPGAIVVWRHHVGRITAVSGNRILVLSGNDGRAVRHRWRAVGRAIAFRFVS